MKMQARFASSWRPAAITIKLLSSAGRVTMNFFQHRYYRLNKIIMTVFGQWPFQSSRTRRCFCAAIIYTNVSEIVTDTLNCVKYRTDMSILLDCMLPLLANCISLSIFIVFMSNSQKTLQLLNRIRKDWKTWAQHQEVNILHTYADHGQKINILFTGMVYFTIIADVTQAALPKIIDIMVKNGTEPGKFPTYVEYYNIDTQKYYFYIMVYYSLLTSIVFGVITTNNIMLVTYVQHACAIFSALGHKLERIADNDRAMKTDEAQDVRAKRAMVHLDWCIDRHNDAIEYAALIEGVYAWNMFFTVAFGVILSNAIGLQFFLNATDVYTMEPEVIMRCGLFITSLVFLFFVDCYIAQSLMDHSLDIHFYIYDNQWYQLSAKNQKILQLMMMRCAVPCQLSAGKILVLSMRTFGMTVRTSLSYLALMRSTQGI